MKKSVSKSDNRIERDKAARYEFSERLMSQMAKVGITVPILAERLGSYRQQVYAWTIGLACPKTIDLPRICEALGCEYKDLLGPVRRVQ